MCRVGRDMVAMASTVIKAGAVIRDGCILNTYSPVDQDNMIGDTLCKSSAKVDEEFIHDIYKNRGKNC